MEFENLLLSQKGTTAIVTVNRPKVLNALNPQTIEELDRAFTQLGQDDGVRAIILTGAGDKAFVAGADISELSKFSAREALPFARRGQEVLSRMERLGKPIIAAINGFALGGGCEIALACHLRLASSKAKLGQPEINLGIIPGFGGTQRLARVVGEGRAFEMVVIGESISAEEALRIGLVNKVVAPEELMPTAEAYAAKIATKSGVIVRYAMEAVHRGLQTTLDEGLNLEANLFALCCTTADKQEGTRAFLEKRPARFQNA